MKTWKGINWTSVARQLGGSIRKENTKEVEIAAPDCGVRITNIRNGELLIQQFDPTGFLLTYDDLNAKGQEVKEATLAYRIGQILIKEPIDYDTRREVQGGAA